MKKKIALWGALFLLFVLSLDFWAWHKAEPLIWGMPFWIVYLFGLTLMLALFYLAFAKFYWRE